MVIDLFDAKGEKVNTKGKLDQIAKKYLNDSIVYDLIEITEIEAVQEEVNTKQKEKDKDRIRENR